jgi:MerR family transcriptional regulator, light-induced transcriptional regulator
VSAAPDPLEDYFRALSAVDMAAATAVVVQLLDDGVPVRQITEAVLAPAQRRVGDYWQAGRWGIADEHAATAVTETALSVLSGAVPRPRRGREPPRHVLVACAEGEWHSLPARMAAVVAAASGARVTVLGPSMPAEQLGRRLAAGDADLLALSCTLPVHLLGAARCVAAAHEEGVPVLVGGSAFGPDARRARALGADAFATDAAALAAPAPALSGRPTALPLEAVLLEAVSTATVALALDRLVACYPPLVELGGYARMQTLEELRALVRCAGAAIVADDPSLLDEQLGVLRLAVPGVARTDVLVTAVELAADAVEPESPAGARLLRDLARRVPQPGP